MLLARRLGKRERPQPAPPAPPTPLETRARLAKVPSPLKPVYEIAASAADGALTTPAAVAEFLSRAPIFTWKNATDSFFRRSMAMAYASGNAARLPRATSFFSGPARSPLLAEIAARGLVPVRVTEGDTPTCFVDGEGPPLTLVVTDEAGNADRQTDGGTDGVVVLDFAAGLSGPGCEVRTPNRARTAELARALWLLRWEPIVVGAAEGGAWRGLRDAYLDALVWCGATDSATCPIVEMIRAYGFELSPRALARTARRPLPASPPAGAGLAARMAPGAVVERVLVALTAWVLADRHVSRHQWALLGMLAIGFPRFRGSLGDLTQTPRKESLCAY
jgi:hypothetical protein